MGRPIAYSSRHLDFVSLNVNNKQINFAVKVRYFHVITSEKHNSISFIHICIKSLVAASSKLCISNCSFNLLLGKVCLN